MENWKEFEERAGKIIMRQLYENGMIKTWYRDNPEGWRFVGGLWSPFYTQLRLLSSYPEVLRNVGYALGRLIHEECPDVDRIIGIGTAGVPIATAITMETGIPSCYTRKIEGVRSAQDFNKRIKDYGEHSMIEGILENGDEVVFADDLVTQFDSKEVALAQFNYELELREIDAMCSDVVVLLDSEQGAEEKAKAQGIILHSLIPFRSKGIGWLSGVLENREREVIADYLENPEKYQDAEVQAGLKQEAEYCQGG